jgi:uncharacterized protein YkwD
MKKRVSKVLKNLFIPSKSNDYRPTFFETRNVLIFLSIVVLIFAFSVDLTNILNISESKYQTSAVLPSILVELANSERVTSSLNILNQNELLNAAATLKAQDMAAKSYFAHISPEGRTPWSWLRDVNYVYEYAGENLAVNFSDSKYVTNAWMKSPTHAANIMKAEYTEIGTGVATGTYNGKKSIFVAQVYAKPFGQVQQKIVAVNAGSAFVDFNSIKEFFSYFLYNNSDLTSWILIGLLIFVIVALLLVIFIRRKIQYGILVMNGLIVCLVIVILLLVNNYIQKGSSHDIQYSSMQYTLDQSGQNVILNEEVSSR